MISQLTRKDIQSGRAPDMMRLEPDTFDISGHWLVNQVILTLLTRFACGLI